ncbi:MAG: pyrimidine dimer DNA glycosylase/endonuclease V [Rhodanobacteraceae bacterium]
MRLWTLHPKYLDPQGLVALWREALLAKAVLRGETRGYTHHPQLKRFKSHHSPRLAINAYLAAVHADATLRGYTFDRTKVGPVRRVTPVAVTCGQISHEWEHLLQKLAVRSPLHFERLRNVARPACHPLFRPRSGPVASWERLSSSDHKTSRLE